MSALLERGGYGFTPMTRSDLAMLGTWLNEPHLQPWWGAPDEQFRLLEEGLGLDWVDAVVVSRHGVPFAYLQCYDLHSEDYAPHDDQPPGARGLDTFIGVPAMLGQGHCAGYLSAYGDHRLSTGTPRLVIDPSEDNVRAIRAYAAAGFRTQRLHVDDDGRFLIMTRDAARIST